MDDFDTEIQSDELAEREEWEAERMAYLDSIGFDDDDEAEAAEGDDFEIGNWFQPWDGV